MQNDAAQTMRVLAVALPVAAIVGSLHGYLWNVHLAPFLAKRVPLLKLWFPDFIKGND
jgi:hypothetical protein